MVYNFVWQVLLFLTPPKTVTLKVIVSIFGALYVLSLYLLEFICFCGFRKMLVHVINVFMELRILAEIMKDK